MGYACCFSSPPSANAKAASVLTPLSLVQNLNDLDDLINYIDQRLNAIANARKPGQNASGSQPAPSSRVTYCIKYGEDLLRCIQNKICSKYFLNRATKKLLHDVLKGAGRAHWVATGLSVVAYVVDQMDQISENNSECVRQLEYMLALANRIKQLNEQLPQEKNKLNDTVQFIVKGCVLCISQMQASCLSRLFSAAVEAQELKSFQAQLGRTYSDLKMGAVIALLEDRRISLRPSQGNYPDAVGLDKARDDVIRLLDLENQSTRKIVVVYGVGGIGKTTLATAVFNTLNLKGYKHCRVIMKEGCSLSDIQSLQEQILRDLFEKNIGLRSYKEGQEQLSEAFRKEPTRHLFMFIDNALRGSDLAMLLPKDLSCLPGHSRVLITTRRLDETNRVLHPHIQRCAYLVEPLPSSEAKKFLCKKVLGSVDANFDRDIDIDDLVKCCGGIPLVLELVGSNLLSDGSKVSHWLNFLKETRQQVEEELSEQVVDCVYHSLQDSYKEAFLDIASFFLDKPREYVAKIVGEVQMKGLEDAALVKTSGRRSKVTMHDIVRARGQWLSKSNRITDIESLKAVLRDPQRLQQLKGIKIEDEIDLPFDDESEKIEFKAELLDLTSQTLRILQVDKWLGVEERFSVKVEGRCERQFENLRFLDLGDSENNTCLSMGLNNLKNLAVCHGKRLSMNNYDCKIAESLRVLKLKYSSTLPESLGDLSLLEELKLDKGTFVSLPHSLGQLKSLRHLSLSRCRELTILPESLGNLSSLEKLYLDTCKKLEGLPQSVSQLSSLQELGIPFCEKLSRLPKKFGELKSLKYLNIECCGSLRNLSEDFGGLTSLAAMKAKGCSELEDKAMDTLAELKSLMFLNIEGSPKLMARWDEIKENHPLVVYSSPESWGRIWQTQFRKMMSWEFFHSGRRLIQLDHGGELVEWIPLSSSLDGQAKVGLLFTACDLCAPSNSEGLQIVREKCTELRRQGFDIVYVEVVGLGEFSQQSEEHIRQALLSLSPGTIACIAPHKNMSQLFAYYAYKAGKDVELTLALDALNTFLVKPLYSQQSGHSFDEFECFDRLFSPLEDLRLTVMPD